MASALGVFAGNDPLIPYSTLRGKRAGEFHPGLVKLLESDVREILSLTGQKLPTRGREEAGVRNERLRGLELQDGQLTVLLKASSGTVREWALRTIGERKMEELPRADLVRIATNGSERLFVRALAVRVLRDAVDEVTAETLLAELGRSEDVEFQQIILETLASAEASAVVIEELKEYLKSPKAAIQFEAFTALRRITAGGDIPGMPRDYARAVRLSDLIQRDAAEAAQQGLQMLREEPAYFRCTGLRSLAYQTNQPGAVTVLLGGVGDPDSFVSQLAGNVLGSLPSMDSRGVAALAEGLGRTNEAVRLQALLRLNVAGQKLDGIGEAVVTALNRMAKEGAPARETGLCLEIARKLGPEMAAAAPSLVEMLSESSPVYQDLSKHEVDRIRGMAFVALAACGVPAEALDATMSALANSDESSMHEFAGAARAAARLGPRGRGAIPHLLRALNNVETSWSGWIALETFDAHTSSNAAYTTPQVEALRALAVLGANDPGVIRSMRAFVKTAPADYDGIDAGVGVPNAREEALKALSNAGATRFSRQTTAVRKRGGE